MIFSLFPKVDLLDKGSSLIFLSPPQPIKVRTYTFVLHLSLLEASKSNQRGPLSDRDISQTKVPVTSAGPRALRPEELQTPPPSTF